MICNIITSVGSITLAVTSYDIRMLNKKTQLYCSMIHPPKKTEQVGRPPDTTTLPLTFDPAYVEGAVKPFFLSAKYEGEPPLLPMIDVAFSKEAAIPPHIFGMLYDLACY